jgi:glutathione synthase
MRLCLVVNDVATETTTYTTTRLAMAAVNRGHEVWCAGVAGFEHDAAGHILAWASRAPGDRYKLSETFLAHLQGPKARRARINIDEFDVLLLRNDPAVEQSRPWAKRAGIMFGRLAVRRGVIVLNDPNGLAQAENKQYLELFPEQVRPKTLITRDAAQVKAFAREHGDSIVLKPLEGSGGQSVFLVRPEDRRHQPRRLHHRPRVLACCCRGGHAPFHDEWAAAKVQGQVRRIPPAAQRGRSEKQCPRGRQRCPGSGRFPDPQRRRSRAT